jgi:two-component system response regulator YesN
VKPVILLVDDEEDLVSVLRDAIDLSLPAYRAVGSTSIEEAEKELAGIDSQLLSLVCVDHRLGGRTGLDFIEALQQRYPGVPTILFTGQASPTVEARAQRAGARVLWKPIRLSQWLGEVRSMLSAADGDQRYPLPA